MSERPETFVVTVDLRGKTFQGSATVHSAGRGLYYATVYYGERSKHTGTHTSSGAELRMTCKLVLTELVSAAEGDPVDQ